MPTLPHAHQAACEAPAPPLVRRPGRGPAPLALLGALALAPSCRTYNERAEEALAAFRAGHFERAEDLYAGGDVSGSPFLTRAEAGSVAFAAGDWDGSIEHWGAAAEAIKRREEQVLISPGSAGEALLSWTVNDSVKDYAGEGYERVLLHAGLALAYLAQGSLEDVGVEVRLADRLLTTEEELYETTYRAGGLAHFVSAVSYELRDRLDDAWIDYRRMQDKGLAPPLVGPALVRLARARGSGAEAELLERYGEPAALPEGAASVVLVAGVGLGSYKRETTLTLPGPDALIQWSVPAYVRRAQPVSGLELAVASASAAARSVVIEDVSAVAEKNLQDRLAWLAAKSAGRAALKYALTRELERDHGLLGLLAGSVFTLASERADLRAWLTLPDTWQAARLWLPPGEHTLVLRALGGDSRVLGTFELAPGETAFVIARTLGTRLFAHVVGGRPLETAPRSEAPTPVS